MNQYSINQSRYIHFSLELVLLKKRQDRVMSFFAALTNILELKLLKLTHNSSSLNTITQDHEAVGYLILISR